MWPSLISKAKRGGLDVIQTYVFWNLHEPRRGQVDGSNLSPSLPPFKNMCGKAHFLPGHISVWFQWTTWHSTFHQTNSSKGPICKSQDRTLRGKWMELWVNKIAFTFESIYKLTLKRLKLIFWRAIYCRGLPFWLHDIPGIVYRSDNEPFKVLLTSKT